MKIAIVGAGVSGLVAAHLLSNTARVDTEDATHHVDTGFIVFNDRNYPNFERLLARLRVPSEPSSASGRNGAPCAAARAPMSRRSCARGATGCAFRPRCARSGATTIA
jgi:predicted NAD/FAD-binding protein